MKLFLKIFTILLIIVLAFGIFNNLVYQKTNWETINSILNYIMIALSCPLYLIDKTYPFYAQGSIGFVISLSILNLLVQTIFVFIIVKLIKSARKSRAKNIPLL